VTSPVAESQAGCLAVAAGQKRTVTLIVTPSHAATGALKGSVTAHAISASHPAPVVVTHVISGWMRPAPNIKRRWVIFAILLFCLGFFPLVALHVVNWVTGRLTPLKKLRAVSYPIRVRSDRVLDGDGKPFDPKPRNSDQLKTVGSEGGEWGFRGPENIEGVSFRAVASGRFRDRRFRPFRGPYGVASTLDHSAILGYRGQAPLLRLRDDAHWETPLNLDGLWFFRPNSPEPHVDESRNDDVLGRQPLDNEVAGKLSVLVRDGESSASEPRLAMLAAEILVTISIPVSQPVREPAPRGRRISGLFGKKAAREAPRPKPEDDSLT
jgi:hypothetical protein